MKMIILELIRVQDIDQDCYECLGIEECIVATGTLVDIIGYCARYWYAADVVL
jgi:hypothetical protein